MAGVAHDLKNLMSGLRTGIYYLDDVLREHESDQARQAWALLTGAQRSIEALVSDLVAYGKGVTLVPEPCDLAAIVRQAVDLVADRAREKGVALDVDLRPVPEASLDGSALERCVLNLLTNAVDAAPAGRGHVAVRLRAGAGETELTVADDGPGIPEDRRTLVFDLRYSTKGLRGTGFGLANVRDIVEGHGGRVAVEAGPDAGATFVVTLPSPAG
jgi:signal transduction histidine kinase